MEWGKCAFRTGFSGVILAGSKAIIPREKTKIWLSRPSMKGLMKNQAPTVLHANNDNLT